MATLQIQYNNYIVDNPDCKWTYEEWVEKYYNQFILDTARQIIDFIEPTEIIPSQIIDFNEDTVTLECLVDEENLVYEKQEFKKSLFNGFIVELGAKYLLVFFQKENTIVMKLEFDNSLNDSDFHSIDFVRKYNNLNLNK